MNESNLFSQRWIYENVFGLSQDEWTTEQEQVIEDLKQDFRREQIKSEGNDPKKTNQSFGTPHDLAFMQMKGQENLGQGDPGAEGGAGGAEGGGDGTFGFTPKPP